MKVADILKGNHKPFTSFELVPPLKGSDINKLYSSIEPLMEFNPPFINMTAHRDEIEYRLSPDGTFRQLTVTKRPGTVAIAAAIMKRFDADLETVMLPSEPSIACVSSTYVRELIKYHHPIGDAMPESAAKLAVEYHGNR